MPADENPDLKGAPVKTAEQPGGVAPDRRHRIRNSAVVVLVVLSSIMVLVSTVGLWSYRQVYNTDVFVGHVDSILARSDVQANLANYLTDQIMIAVNPEQRARDALPSQADALIAPVVSAIRGFVNQTVQKVVASDQFRKLVDQSARLAHTAAIRLLEGKQAAGLTINGNEAVFNTLPMIDQVLQQISSQGLLGNRTIPALSTPSGQPSAQLQELSSKLGVTLPPDFGQLVVFKSNSLKSAQQALRLIKRGLLLVIVATVLLIALTLLLSLHRLRTLAELGIGIAVAMLVAWAVTKAVTRDVLNQIGTPAGRQTLLAVGNDLLSSLRTIAIILTIIGVVVAFVAFVSGGSRSARWIRTKFTRLWRPEGGGEVGPATGSFGAFIVVHRDGLRIVGAGVGILILLIAGLTWPAVIATVVVEAVWQGAIWYFVGRVTRGAEDKGGAAPPEATGPAPGAEATPLVAGGSAP
jgi:hypothetical protein